jgi:hypothetical protein
MSVSPGKHPAASSAQQPFAYSPRTGAIVNHSVFFVLFFLYVWLIVEPRLIYHGAGTITNFPTFFKTWDFFRFTAGGRPGGLVEYGCAFLAQLFYSNWAGALVITTQAWLLTIATACLLKVAGLSGLAWLRFIPPILLLPIYGQYTYQFTTLTALCVALSFACLYVRITRAGSNQVGIRHDLLRAAFSLLVYLGLSIALYTLTAGAYLLFALLCAIYELLYQRRYLIACLCVLAAAIPYAQGVLLFGVSIIDAYCDLLPISWKVVSYASRRRAVEFVYLLYLFLPLCAVLAALWQGLLRPRPAIGGPDKPRGQAHNNEKSRRNLAGTLRQAMARYRAAARLRYVTASLVLLGAAAAVAAITFDARRKTLIEVDYYAANRMWPEVLETARCFCDDPIIIFAVNRALYHTGRLGYDVCAWPQHPDTLLLTADEYRSAYWKRFDIRLDLGLLNMAENDLTECLEIFGPQPLILKRLALVNMAKGNLGSAKVYLGALSKTLFDTDWANHYLALLRNDPNLTSDKHIQLLRANQLKDDRLAYGGFQAKPQVLSALLQSNPKNHMAFEYLAAWYLLTKQLDQFVEHLKRIDDFDYLQIPPLYEEAVLIYMSRTNKPVDLGGRRGSDESRQRMDRFAQTFNRYGQNKVAAFRELVRDFGNSYYFYFLYGFSGVKL